jgi:hypothetical protein
MSVKNMTTEELKKIIELELKMIPNECQVDAPFFEKNTERSPEGTYVFSDSQGYHYVYSERGSESIHKITDDTFEIRYWVVSPIVFTIAGFFERQNRIQGEDIRRLLFEKALEVMSTIGTSYRKRTEIYIDEVLKLHPYVDICQ